ncbi:MAG: hypothetical protein LQ339_003643 [Xanthoria mediterranea]|nr:MAG: hypothetical protein LQ339_003643 [Xanthoria mediterranea]
MAPASVASSVMEYSSMPETPTSKQSRLPHVRHQMRASAEKFNRHNRLIRQRSPPVPEADLNTSKLAIAFPGFSGVAEDIKPFSPNPFLDHGDKHMNQDAASKANLDTKRHYQPRVRDENDVSILSETQPSLAGRHNRNTRFGQIYIPKVRKGPQPHMYNPAPGLVQNAAAEATSANVSKPFAINAHGSLTSIPNGSTQQTLNLPHGSNLTDIFSGVVRQPPPVDSQPARPRASRFTSSKPQEAAEPKAEEVAVPANERHLLRSIDTLQARVNELEKLQVQLESTNSNLEQKTLDLQAEKSELEGRHRRDSAAGSTESGNGNADDAGASYEQLASKNKRLETHNWALVRQKDIFVQNLQDLEQERDHYQERSAAAESKAARLYSENATVGQQHAQAVADLNAANSDIDVLAQDKEDLLAEVQHLRAHINITARSSANGNGIIDLTAEFADGPDAESSNLQFDQQSKAQHGEDMDVSEQSLIEEKSNAQQIKHNIEQQSSAHGKAPSCDSSYNITYVSYAGQTGSCVVRKDLENERKARHQLRQAEASKGLVNNTIGQHASEEHVRQPSNSSVSTTRIRPHNALADRTSSLLMEDFTLTKPPTTDDQAANLPATAPAALPLPLLDLAPLDTVHNETPQSGLRNTGAQPAQAAIEPAKKLTVSDEELDITIYDEEPTERPSQPPAAALAAVLESVQAERTLQLTQLAKYQANYNRHDTALNRRQRKQLHSKIIALTESVDRKADQIYNLHDLVADQERKGQSMTQNQVDNTLQSLGLELPWQGIASSTTTSQRRGSASSRSL